MKIAPDQLAKQLQRGLLPVYLLSGDEPFLLEEARTAIRQAAQSSGYDEILSFVVETGFDWSAWSLTARMGSLFSDRQLIELRFLSDKLTEVAKQHVLDYLQNTDPQKILLVMAPKLDAATQKTAWVKQMDQHGGWVQFWPLPVSQLGMWIQRRLQTHQLKIVPEALDLLVMRTQGNLLAAAQEVEKLALLYAGNPAPLTLEAVRSASVDQAHFELFDLVAPLQQGKSALAIRILSSLRQTGVDPLLIIWLLARELRLWMGSISPSAQGGRAAFVDKRQAQYQSAASRHTFNSLRSCLAHLLQIDQIAKGAACGSVWDELVQQILAMTGVGLSWIVQQ